MIRFVSIFYLSVICFYSAWSSPIEVKSKRPVQNAPKNIVMPETTTESNQTFVQRPQNPVSNHAASSATMTATYQMNQNPVNNHLISTSSATSIPRITSHQLPENASTNVHRYDPVMSNVARPFNSFGQQVSGQYCFI